MSKPSPAPRNHRSTPSFPCLLPSDPGQPGLVHLGCTASTGLLLLPLSLLHGLKSSPNPQQMFFVCSAPSISRYLLSHRDVCALQRSKSRYPIFALVTIWPGLTHFLLLLFSNLPSQVSPIRRLLSQAAWVSLFILEQEQGRFCKASCEARDFHTQQARGWQSAMGQLWNEKGLEELSGCPWDTTPSPLSPFSSRGADVG